MVQIQDQEDLRIFLEELEENLNFLDNSIISLEENPEDKSTLEEIFRTAHTIKGNAGFLDLKNLVDLGHAMESVFQQLEKGAAPVNSSVIDTLLECKDAIASIGHALRDGEDPTAIPTQHLIDKVNSFLSHVPDTPEKTDTPAAPSGDSGSEPEDDLEYIPDTDLIRVWISPNEPAPSVRAFLIEKKISDISTELVKVYPGEEEREDPEFAGSDREIRFWVVTDIPKDEIPDLITVDLIERIEVLDEEDFKKLESRSKAAAQQSESSGPAKSREDISVMDTVRIPVARLDVLLNLVGELVIANSGLIQIQEYMKNRPELEELDRQVKDRTKEIFRISGDVQELVMKSRLVPIGQVFSRFKRFVRDYSTRTGKKINLEISGEETEIDKKIIDEMIKPLTHLVRNSVDHGIEDPDIRQAKKKPETGTLRLNAFQEGNYINVAIEDDGKGLDFKSIIKKAIQKNVITRDEAEHLTDDEIKMLIFHSGFSTKENADDISGRGIGMDIVKRSVELLNGSIDLHTEKDAGTRIIIKLPLTLAIINALIVKVGEEKFSVPMASIVETQKVSRMNILMIEGSEMVRLRDTLIPLIRLDHIFDIPVPEYEHDRQFPVIVVEFNETLVGLLVEQFLSRHEMVIKSLADHYRPVEGISGASIMGDGEIILIIDVHGVIQLYKQLTNSAIGADRPAKIKMKAGREESRESLPQPPEENKEAEKPRPTEVSEPAVKDQPSEAEKEVSPEPGPEDEANEQSTGETAPGPQEGSSEADTASEEPATEQTESTEDKADETDSDSEDSAKQNMVDELIKQAREEAEQSDSGVTDEETEQMTDEPTEDNDNHEGALSFHRDEHAEDSLKTLRELFNTENRELLKEWLKQGNYRAIQGIQQLTGSETITLDKSKGRHISVSKSDKLINKIESSDDEIYDFMLPINPLNGAVHFILNRENALKMVNLLMTAAGLDASDTLETEPLLEVTNILGSAYTNSLTQLTEVPVEPGVPMILEGKDKIVEQISEKLKGAKFEILYIENQFVWDRQDILAELLILVPEIKV